MVKTMCELKGAFNEAKIYIENRLLNKYRLLIIHSAIEIQFFFSIKLLVDKGPRRTLTIFVGILIKA